MPASGWGSLWESSSFVPWFSTFVFRNVPGTVPECVVICWFKRNSSNLDRAPKMRDSVLLNYWDSFLLTLPSISSETCVIYSSLILGTDVFHDWPFLGCSSCVSLVTAGCQLSFLSQRCHSWRQNATQLWRLKYFVFVNQVEIITKMLLFKINNWSQSVQSTDNQSDIMVSTLSTFVSPIYTFSLAGNIIVYTPSKGTK